MGRVGRLVSSIVGTIVSVPVALAGPAALQGMRLSAQGDRTSLVVFLSDVRRCRLFTLSAPDRVVVDFDSTRLAGSALPLPAGNGAVRQVRVANRANGSVRVVLDLAASVTTNGSIRRGRGADGDQFVLDLTAAPDGNGPPPPPEPRLAHAAQTGAARRDMAPAAEPPVGGLRAPTSTSDEPDARAGSESDSTIDGRPAGRDLIIAVDAGHGGKDPGAHGPHGILEKNVTLRIARQLADAIDAEPGMRSVLTRNRDKFIRLRSRMERARAARADLFVSIHADSVRNRSVRGASIYVLNEKGATDEAARRLAARENAADLIGGVSLGNKDHTLASVLLDLSQNAALSSSIDVADQILAELAHVGAVRKTQVMQAPFMVLKSPDVPSVLIETAYISNPQEERRLASPAYHKRLAGAILAGVRNYFYKNPPRGTLVAELSRQRLAGSVQHVIRRGETLSRLAVRYNTSVSQIRTANHLTDDHIAAGRILQIPLVHGT